MIASDPALAGLIAASIAFVGAHFAMSHPLRAPLVRRLGEKGFLGLYSLVSLGTFVWMILAFRAVPPRGQPLWNGGSAMIWVIASLLTILALVLFLGSFRANPAFPGASPAETGPIAPQGVFAVTRHPMMWGFGLWALSHILVAPTPRTLVLAGALGFLALVGARLQDRKKRRLLGDAWLSWEARTTFWPQLRALPGIGLGLWALTFALWLALTWAHVVLAYVPAGIWRWIG